MSRQSFQTRAVFLVLTLIVASLAGMQSAVTVVSATPYSGSPPGPTNLTVYYHNLTTPVTIGGQYHLKIANTLNDTNTAYSATGDNISAVHYLTVEFTVYPQLSGPLVLNGTIYSWMYFSQSGSAPTSGHITLGVSEVSPTGTLTLLGSGPAFTTSSTAPGSSATSVMLTGPTLNQIVPANDSLMFNITVSGGTSQVYNAYWGNVNGTYFYSRASVSASSYLEVSNMSAVDSKGQPVYSLSQSASDKNITVYANLTDPFGQYDFASWPVDYSVQNATGTVFASGVMTPVGAYSAFAFMRQYEFVFNYSSFAPGSLTVTLNGTDNTMHNYLTSFGVTYGRNAYGTLQLYVGTPPISVSFTVMNAAGNAVSGAQVRIMQLSYLVGYNTTGASGLAAMMLSQGNYTVDVYWQSVKVGSFPVSVSSTSTQFALKAGIYSPLFVFEDQSGTALSFAQVQLVSPAGIGIPLMYSASNGSISLSNVAGGEYLATVFWHGSMVFNGTISIDANGVHAVNVAAYMQTFEVVTSSGSTVATANVVVVNSTTGIYAGFNTTNASGLASAVIPYGVYNIQVYWKGILVYNAAAQRLDNSTPGTLVLNASIYDVTVIALSSGGSPLSNVEVSLYSNTTGTVLSGVTGTNGQATFTVAAGKYTLTSSFYTTYDLTPVAQKITQTLSISNSTSQTVKFTDVYPPLTSTNLFYVVLGVVAAIIAAAAIVVFFALRKTGSSAKHEEEQKGKPGN